MHIYAYVRQASFGFLLLALIGVSGCSKTPATEADSSPSAKTDPAAKPAPEPPRPAPPRVVTLPQGTVIEARLDEALSTRTSRVGDRFRATLAEPLIDGDRVVVPRDA